MNLPFVSDDRDEPPLPERRSDRLDEDPRRALDEGMEGDDDLTARAVALHVREVEAAARGRPHVEVGIAGAQADVHVEIRARGPREDRRAVSQSGRANGSTCADARRDSAALSSPGSAGRRRARRLDPTLCERAPQAAEEEAQAAVRKDDEVGVVDRVPAPRCGGCDAQASAARDWPVQNPALRARSLWPDDMEHAVGGPGEPDLVDVPTARIRHPRPGPGRPGANRRDERGGRQDSHRRKAKAAHRNESPTSRERLKVARFRLRT